MPKNGSNALKQAARNRARETGESYTEARSAILKEWKDQASSPVSVPVSENPPKVIRPGDEPAGPWGPRADLVIYDEITDPPA